jgi:hypothetical protein
LEKEAREMSKSVSLVVTRHGAFGVLATLRIAAQPARRFTLREAAIVARALEAVARGASAETQIYMSPIASDQDFDVRVEQDGVVIMAEGGDDARLSWPETLALVDRLKKSGDAL